MGKKRTRKAVGYLLGAAGGAAALALLNAQRQRPAPKPMDPPDYPRWYTAITEKIDKAVGWNAPPLPIQLAVLAGIRMRMRERNLYDTATPAYTRAVAPEAPKDQRHLGARTDDGTFNDLDDPAMGAAQTRFGRNVPIDRTYPEPEPALLTPNPRVVSNELLARKEFIPATTLNLLAASWLQFMVHDWFSHGKNSKEHKWTIPLADDDPFPQHPMEILHTRRDPHTAHDSTLPPTYANVVTHWWDASQLYGSDARTVARGRAGEHGKLKVGEDGLLPVDPHTGTDVAGVEGNWWIGLSMLHNLFTLEHNAICDRLHAEYPTWSDDELFDKARLINAALLAKIHTVEWTPAILGDPALQIAMRANWWGLEEERLGNVLGRLSANEVISGIPGGPTAHFGVPYSITEEFVAVYRMHPLVPDVFSFRAHADNRLLREVEFPDAADRNTRTVLDAIGLPDLFYSFGTSHPGAITLHNFPKHLRLRKEPDGTVIDLAAIDIMRTRERGVPRYNDFRELVHRPRVRTFEELVARPEWAEGIRRVYDNDIDRVDLVVGLFAEPVPAGFGFSDTAFRIFTLMASRRLNSDRFFTVDFTPKTYTQEGIDWIAQNGMASVIQRHLPAIAPAMRGVKNPFAPWNVAALPKVGPHHHHGDEPAPTPDPYPVPERR